MTQIFEMSLLALGPANHGFQVGDDTKGLQFGGRDEQLGVWIIQNYQAVKSWDWGKNLEIAKQRVITNINQPPILRMRARPTQQWVQYIAREQEEHVGYSTHVSCIYWINLWRMDNQI